MLATKGLVLKSYQITPHGIEELKSRLQALKKRQQETVEEFHEDVDQEAGISSFEDSASIIDQETANEIEDEISSLEYIIGKAKIISKPTTTESVQLGSTVKVDLNGNTQTYTIVGPIEADPDNGLISNESPLGNILLGKKISETIEFQTVSNTNSKVKVLDIK
jgi:transcription elongation factor GreA